MDFQKEAFSQFEEFTESEGAQVIYLSAHMEHELSQFDADEQLEYLQELGLSESGLSRLSVACFNLLGLQTYYTAGPKEVRAWTIKQGSSAPVAAGVIHTDFEKGFIRANIVSFDDFKSAGGWKNAKSEGLVRQEGKEYIMQPDDVVEFLFNV